MCLLVVCLFVWSLKFSISNENYQLVKTKFNWYLKIYINNSDDGDDKQARFLFPKENPRYYNILQSKSKVFNKGLSLTKRQVEGQKGNQPYWKFFSNQSMEMCTKPIENQV